MFMGVVSRQSIVRRTLSLVVLPVEEASGLLKVLSMFVGEQGGNPPV